MRYFRVDMDVELVYAVDDDGDVVDAVYVFDSASQLAPPAFLDDPSSLAAYLTEIGDTEGKCDDEHDIERAREALALDRDGAS